MLHVWLLNVSCHDGFQKADYIEYVSADLCNSHAMVTMDICDIQYLENTFDVIYCSHVLEHVPTTGRLYENSGVRFSASRTSSKATGCFEGQTSRHSELLAGCAERSTAGPGATTCRRNWIPRPEGRGVGRSVSGSPQTLGRRGVHGRFGLSDWTATAEIVPG